MLPELPCGCPAAKQFSTMLLPDGSRICRAHGRRYVISWKEESGTISLPSPAPAPTKKRSKKLEPAAPPTNS